MAALKRQNTAQQVGINAARRCSKLTRLTWNFLTRIRVRCGAAIFTRHIGNESEGKRIHAANKKLRHQSIRSNEDIAFVKEAV